MVQYCPRCMNELTYIADQRNYWCFNCNAKFYPKSMIDDVANRIAKEKIKPTEQIEQRKEPEKQEITINLEQGNLPLDITEYGCSNLFQGSNISTSDSFRNLLKKARSQPSFGMMFVVDKDISSQVINDITKRNTDMARNGMITDNLLRLPSNKVFSLALPFGLYDDTQKVSSLLVANRKQLFTISRFSNSVLGGGNFVPVPSVTNGISAPAISSEALSAYSASANECYTFTIGSTTYNMRRVTFDLKEIVRSAFAEINIIVERTSSYQNGSGTYYITWNDTIVAAGTAGAYCNKKLYSTTASEISNGVEYGTYGIKKTIEALAIENFTIHTPYQLANYYVLINTY